MVWGIFLMNLSNCESCVQNLLTFFGQVVGVIKEFGVMELNVCSLKELSLLVKSYDPLASLDKRYRTLARSHCFMLLVFLMT